MIIRGLFELIYSLLSIVLTPFQIIPDMPSSIVNRIDVVINFLTTPLQIFCFFFHPAFLKLCIPVFLIVVNMRHIWDGILWILKKLPFVGIE